MFSRHLLPADRRGLRCVLQAALYIALGNRLLQYLQDRQAHKNSSMLVKCM